MANTRSSLNPASYNQHHQNSFTTLVLQKNSLVPPKSTNLKKLKVYKKSKTNRPQSDAESNKLAQTSSDVVNSTSSLPNYYDSSMFGNELTSSLPQKYEEFLKESAIIKDFQKSKSSIYFQRWKSHLIAVLFKFQSNHNPNIHKILYLSSQKYSNRQVATRSSSKITPKPPSKISSESQTTEKYISTFQSKFETTASNTVLSAFRVNISTQIGEKEVAPEQEDSRKLTRQKANFSDSPNGMDKIRRRKQQDEIQTRQRANQEIFEEIQQMNTEYKIYQSRKRELNEQITEIRNEISHLQNSAQTES